MACSAEPYNAAECQCRQQFKHKRTLITKEMHWMLRPMLLNVMSMVKAINGVLS